MPLLTIGGEAYDVAEVERMWESLVSITAMDDGTLTSSRGVSSRTAARTWRCTTDLLTDDEAATLRAALTAPGTIEAGGAAIGVSGTVECLARGVGAAVQLLDDWWTVSFELVEV